MIYFDNAASTKVLQKAADAARFVMLNCYANPSSLHNMGLQSDNIINSCRKTIAKTLLKNENEIFFTSGATESINLAILGASKKFNGSKKNKIVTSTIEHKATLNCLHSLKEQGFEIVKVAAKNKEFVANDFVDAVDEKCFLVSIMQVNNENGLILPVEEIAKKIKEKNENILIHVDAAQSFLKLNLNLNNIDLCSISSHKVNGPKGIGALYVCKNAKIKPLMFGGSQEKNMRPGTQATALIKAFEVAINENNKNKEKNFKHYLRLKEIIVEKLKDNKNINFNFTKNCVPYIINISVKGVKSQVLMQFLEEKGFFVSAGSACSKSFKNEVILNLNYDKNIANSAIRISFGIFNTEAEVESLAECITLAEKTLLKF